MEKYKIVIDTNVVFSALLSNRGASYKLLSVIDQGMFEFAISVPLFIEYESVLKRNIEHSSLSNEEIDDVLDYLAKICDKREIYFLWRPFFRDPKDDLVLEVAVESESQFIVFYNKKNFKNIEKFGLTVVTPKEFLLLIKVLK